MRAILMLLVVVVLVAIAAISLGYVDVSQTRTASLPSVEVRGGQAPAYDVRTANVVVGQKEQVVKVPTVGQKNEVVQVPTVGQRNEVVQVPTVDVQKPR